MATSHRIECQTLSGRARGSIEATAVGLEREAAANSGAASGDRSHYTVLQYASWFAIIAMASAKDTATFFTHGTHTEYEQVLKLYPTALKLKADRRAKKPEELVKLDNW